MKTALASISWTPTLFIILFVLVLILLACVIILFIRYNVLANDLLEERRKRRAIGDKVDDLTKRLNPTTQQQRTTPNNSVIQITSKLKVEQNAMHTSSPATTEEPLETSVEQDNHSLYAKTFKNGLLKECSREEADFEIFNIDGDTARFEFCGNETKAISNSDSTFDDICDREGILDGATAINNIVSGEVRRQDGKWKVTKKAKIKFL